MWIAIVSAGFGSEQAGRLRQSLANFRKRGGIAKFQDFFYRGMLSNVHEAIARRCFAPLEGIASYGSPECHAASFALIVYASTCLKLHHLASFACALLYSQPRRFYAPSQIVSDVRRGSTGSRQREPLGPRD